MPTTNESRTQSATKLLKAQEIAEILQTSAKTVSDMARADMLPCIRVGSQFRFIESDVIDYLRGQK